MHRDTPYPDVLAIAAAVEALGFVDNDRAEEWRDLAICPSADPEIFHPKRGDVITSKMAKKICSSCPVEDQCLAYALEKDLDWGIWGGKSASERKAIRARTNKHPVQALEIAS
jgi:WhiB family redox-sensing transcriptional regulator